MSMRAVINTGSRRRGRAPSCELRVPIDSRSSDRNEPADGADALLCLGGDHLAVGCRPSRHRMTRGTRRFVFSRVWSHSKSQLLKVSFWVENPSLRERGEGVRSRRRQHRLRPRCGPGAEAALAPPRMVSMSGRWAPGGRLDGRWGSPSCPPHCQALVLVPALQASLRGLSCHLPVQAAARGER